MKTIITIFFIVLASSLFAQSINYEINTSKTFKQKNNNLIEDYKLIYENDKYYFIDLRPSENHHSIVKITKDFKNSTKKTLELSKKTTDEIASRLGDNIVVINKVHSSKENTNTINIKTINKTTLSIEESDDLYIQKEGKYDFMLKFSVEESEDKSKLAILYTQYTKKKDAYKFGILVINDDLEIIWHEDNFSPQFRGTYNQEDFFVSNNGDVFLIGRVIQNPDNNPEAVKFSRGNIISGYYTYKVDNPEYKYQIYRISDDGSSTDYINLEIPNYDIRNIRIDIKGEIITAYGIYRNMGSIDALGCFISEIDIDAETLKMIDIKAFTKKMITEGFNEKELSAYNKRKTKGNILDPYNYELSNLKYKDNGEAYFIAEQRLFGHKETTDYKMTNFDFNDIYVVDLNQEKNIENINKISKRQNYPYPWFLSYSEIFSEDTHYLIFNTTVKHKLKKCILASLNNDNNKEIIELMKYKNRSAQGFISLKNCITEPSLFLYVKSDIMLGRNFSIETLRINE